MDMRYLRRAVELAEQGRGRTSPNPMVGAVIVKDGQIVGEAFHEKAGKAHAEINALAQAGSGAEKAEMYVTLEPCCFHGRTPPCTAAIIEAGIKKVVVGLQDPNPKVSGRGIEELVRKGIEAEVGFLTEEIAGQNEAYIKYITTGLPFVLMKAATSLDGKLAANQGECTVMSNEKSRDAVHVLRDQHDAIVVGIGTVIADDPLLTVRIKGRESKNPLRIILDSTLRISLDSRIAATASDVSTMVVCAKGDRAKKRMLENKGVEILEMSDGKGRVDLAQLMQELGRREISSVLWEGGSKANAAALKAGIVDKILLYIAPVLVGNPQAPGLAENGFKASKMSRYRISDTYMSAGDIVVEAYPADRPQAPAKKVSEE